MAASSTCGPDCCILGAKRTKEARDAFLIYAVVWTGKSRVEKLWEKMSSILDGPGDLPI